MSEQTKLIEPIWIECEVDCDEDYFHFNVINIEDHEDREWDNSMRVEFIEKSFSDAQALEIEKLEATVKELLAESEEDLHLWEKDCQTRDLLQSRVEKLKKGLEDYRDIPIRIKVRTPTSDIDAQLGNPCFENVYVAAIKLAEDAKLESESGK